MQIWVDRQYDNICSLKTYEYLPWVAIGCCQKSVKVFFFIRYYKRHYLCYHFRLLIIVKLKFIQIARSHCFKIQYLTRKDGNADVGAHVYKKCHVSHELCHKSKKFTTLDDYIMRNRFPCVSVPTMKGSQRFVSPKIAGGLRSCHGASVISKMPIKVVVCCNLTKFRIHRFQLWYCCLDSFQSGENMPTNSKHVC